MGEKKEQVRRKRRSSPRSGGNASKKSGGKTLSWIIPSQKIRKIAVLTLLLGDLYLLSCLYPNLSGSLGRYLYGVLYEKYGFSMVLPLFHGAYQCVAALIGWRVENLRYQIMGTVSLFLSCQLFFGLTHIYGVLSWEAPLLPGAFSLHITGELLRSVGLFGTFLTAMGGIFFSLLCYGMSFSDRFGKLFSFVASFFRRGALALAGLCRGLLERLRRKGKAGKNGSPEAEKTGPPEEPRKEEPQPVRIIRRRAGEFVAEELESGSADFSSEEAALPEASSPGEEPLPGPSGGDLPLKEPEPEPEEELPMMHERELREPEPPRKREPLPSEVPQPKKSLPPLEREKVCVPEKPRMTSEDLLASQEEDEFEMSWEGEEDPGASEFVVPSQVEHGRYPPPPELLGDTHEDDVYVETEELLENGRKITETLRTFGIESTLVETVAGPTVIQYRIQLAPGIKVSKVAGLSDDLAVSLAVSSLRIEAPIPGKPYIGIEVPNPQRKTVSLRSLVEDSGFATTRATLPLPLGVSIDGRVIIANLAEMPHLLVAGTTGAGKSVFISNCLIGLSYIRRPEELRFLLIDPKQVEMTLYEKMPHVLARPVVDPKKAVEAFGWAINEMERRYSLFAQLRVRNLEGFNKKKELPEEKLPHIVIVVDELADLMMTSPKEIEEYICRLAQKARATGIHLVLATQRPSVNVITGLIKANIPARVAFSLPTQADSRTILDTGGAERLLGRGDCLHLTARLPKPLRIQSGWIDESRIVEYIDYLTDFFGEPEYVDISDSSGGKNGGGDLQIDDPLLPDAVDMVMDTGIASASRLQRNLRIGFTRAARLVDYMEQLGIVGPQEGAKARDILASRDEADEALENVGF